MANEEKSLQDQVCAADVEAHIERSQSAVEELQRTSGQLPKVDEDGNSECPFAEQLYAEKEEAQNEVNACLKQMDEYRKWIDEEIAGCKNDLTVISAHQEYIHRDKPRAHYSDAEAEAAATLKHLEEVKENMEEALEQMQESTKEASPKQYPSKIPEKYSSFSTSGSQSSSELDTELKDMIQDGPIE